MSTHKTNINSTPIPLPNGFRDSLFVHGRHGHRGRSTTPIGRTIPANAAHLMSTIEGDLGAEEDPRLSIFRDLYAKSEARLSALLGEKEDDGAGRAAGPDRAESQEDAGGGTGETSASVMKSSLKPTRNINEDDYDESDESDEDDSVNASPLKSRSNLPTISFAPSTSAMLRGFSSSSAPGSAKGTPASTAGKTTEEARKKLEEDKKATEEAAKRSFNTVFYTLENDKDAMLEQKKLEESERQVDVEMGVTGTGSNNVNGGGSAQQGTLSQTNLGASSLALKNLIRVIDGNRDRVPATDTELRTLFSDVRKGRGKWASEEKVGQEELYEAAETVLNTLRGFTEHSSPFLTRVNRKEAPDYSNIIKTPMDLGTMTKKLKSYQYKSKVDFVNDLNLIWANCLKYNAAPEHLLRKKALVMRKEAERLIPLIPNIFIRDRAEVEAEERRQQNGDTNLDDDEDSDDEPIISSRGRAATGGKTSKKGTVARKAPADAREGSSTPALESKPPLNQLPNGLGSNLKNEHLRADSESNVDGSQQDLLTPPPGTITPMGVNAILGHGTQTDAMDVDGESSVNGVVSSDGVHEEAEHDDLEYQTWKQVTKKDRAHVTAERHALFKGDHLDPEQPALRRTKKGMRSWLRKQKQAVDDVDLGKEATEAAAAGDREVQPSGATLAEGMQVDEERLLPDYYDTMAAIPDIPKRLRWIEDSEGNVADPSEEYLRVVPKGIFTAPESNLTRRISDNLRQIQNTRRITSKIGVVKQMQVQSQMYQGQFQKHEPAPFVEQDIQPHVTSEEGHPMAPEVTRAALQRSTAKLMVHAGFEEFQPVALEAITDLAADYFTKLARTLSEYSQAPQIAVPMAVTGELSFKKRFTMEESILHTLQENGADLEALDSYVTEDVERAGTRIAMTHDRMKAHLADSLRPALVDAGPDGSNAFNDDSEQFVGGDFAEELGEDFFGFKELGIDVGGISVPLHLLQNRMRNSNQAQNASSLSSAPVSDFPVPPPLAPITVSNVKNQIGLVHDFFLAKLHANNDQPLLEDEDLPLKQRFPKPRLGANGKITSPRKRPLKEQGPGKGHPRKKMKTNEGEAKETGKENEATKEGENLKANTEKEKPNGVADTNKSMTNGIVASGGGDDTQDDVTPGTPTPKGKGKQREMDGGMISPESLEAT